MQFGLFENTSLNTSAPNMKGAKTVAQTPNGIQVPQAEFNQMVQLQNLLNQSNSLPLNEQSNLLKQLVIDLPKESVHQVTNLIQENFGGVLEAFPQLQQNLVQGDLKGFVKQLNVLTNSNPELQMQLQAQNEGQLANLALPVQMGQQQNLQNTQLENKNGFDNFELPTQKESSSDFLAMREMGQKSNHQMHKNLGHQNQFSQQVDKRKSFFPVHAKESSSQQVTETINQDFMTKLKPGSNMAEYSRMSDQFTDKLIKPNQGTDLLNNNNQVQPNNSTSLATILMGGTGHQGGEMQGDSAGLEAGITTKTLDLSNISASNKGELINKISNYIQQNAIMNENEVELVVKHDDLGQFKINVQRLDARSNQLEVSIETMSKDGHQFFAENEVELIKNLNNNGIKLSGLKVSQVAEGKFSAFTDNSRNMSDNNSQGSSSNSQSQQQSFTRNQNSGQNGQERRRELWNMYREQANYAA